MRLPGAASVVLVAVLLAGACSSDEGSPAGDGAGPGTTAPTADEVLAILITNDDGYAAPGIDAVVEALRAEPGVELDVVAPAENQSGSGDAAVGGELVATSVMTRSGHPATAVAGKPADSVNYALDTLGLEPDLIVSGTNAGHNIGPVSTISGTVGAVKVGARRGVPGLAVSTGLGGGPVDDQRAARLAVEWVREHRDAILTGTFGVEAVSINVPACGDVEVRGVLEVPLATDVAGRDATAGNCRSTVPESEVTDDVDAFIQGFASLTAVPTA